MEIVKGKRVFTVRERFTVSMKRMMRAWRRPMTLTQPNILCGTEGLEQEIVDSLNYFSEASDDF